MTSVHPDVTARFYIDVLSLPFEKEEHPGVREHWACQFGGLHFAIHHADAFSQDGHIGADSRTHVEDTFLSFTIEDLDGFAQHLSSKGVAVVARREIGPMKFVTVVDPDGRHVGCGTPWPGT
jgi:hypothetical protein